MTSYEDEDNLKSAMYSENIEDARSEKVPDETESEPEVSVENESKEEENLPAKNCDDLVNLRSVTLGLYDASKPLSDRKRLMEAMRSKILKRKAVFGVAESRGIWNPDGSIFSNSSLQKSLDHIYGLKASGKAPSGTWTLLDKIVENDNLQEDKIKLLSELYTDAASPVGFSSKDKLWKEAKRRNAGITKEDVDNFLMGQRAYTLHKQPRYKFKRLKTVTSGLHVDWQADLAVMDKVAAKNDNYKYMLICCDVCSRKVMATPVLSKRPCDMIHAFDRIFSDFAVAPASHPIVIHLRMQQKD
uniref:Integrase catalytic domain-containing protein n=1 Tax=Panagrellus redivivus TaxID=6233 RepID=A0A7E4VGX1_PANRE